MTTDSYRAAMRPLMFTVAWFAFLAAAAFAWANIESQTPAQQDVKPVVFVLKQ
jgi:methionine-rich copper-binding protein CopC